VRFVVDFIMQQIARIEFDYEGFLTIMRNALHKSTHSPTLYLLLLGRIVYAYHIDATYCY